MATLIVIGVLIVGMLNGVVLWGSYRFDLEEDRAKLGAIEKGVWK